MHQFCSLQSDYWNPAAPWLYGKPAHFLATTLSRQTCYTQVFKPTRLPPMRYLALLILLSGCSQTPVIDNIEHFEPSKINTIGFTLKTPRHGDYQTNATTTTLMATEISRRFSKAGYPIHLIGSDTPQKFNATQPPTGRGG